MAQAIAETVFDVFYLGFALIAGLTMLLKGNNPLVVVLFSRIAPAVGVTHDSENNGLCVNCLDGLADLQTVARTSENCIARRKNHYDKTLRKYGFGLCGHRHDIGSIL